ncbi:NAD(P)/FAD-dependent oxidoreductase [Rhizosaccharibacter radicis]|uniref:Thioredoxin reductase n=1 Tax=Rhizosaccharibacter radicis TaxID=2782605 RepID=A0ABT1W2I9_9PROT|nr:NAD(P)/FAD-dependent oxidoreductase [Acetobacteraceae bacterium KSS12]
MNAADDPAAERADCLVVGAGPAGLTAALYLRRFALRTLLVDAGRPRAALIPRTRNQPAFPGGISGRSLLKRMRRQVSLHGVEVADGTVLSAEREADGFVARFRPAGAEPVLLRSRTLLLATGIRDHRPAALPDPLHDRALRLGHVRYCPICDGFEARDRRIAVLGQGAHGMREAIFLRSYSADVFLIPPDGPLELDAAGRARLRDAGVTVLDQPVRRFALRPNGMELLVGDQPLRFDSVYPAMGARIHSDLAVALGAVDEAVCVPVDDHGRTRVPGLYAAGDVTRGLDQIATATALAAAAATAIRNDLADRTPLRRPRSLLRTRDDSPGTEPLPV